MSVINTLIQLLGKSAIIDSNLIHKLEFKTCLVPLKVLKKHEDIDYHHKKLVIDEIVNSGYIKYPLLVDVRTFIVLDGHHRLAALKDLGFKYVPVFFVDYAMEYIDVVPFRKDYHINKITVIRKVFVDKDLFPPKTTRHILHGLRLQPSFISLKELKIHRSKLFHVEIDGFTILCYDVKISS